MREFSFVNIFFVLGISRYVPDTFPIHSRYIPEGRAKDCEPKKMGFLAQNSDNGVKKVLKLVQRLHHGSDDALEEGGMVLTPLYDGIVHYALVNLTGTKGAAVFHVEIHIQFVVGTNGLDSVDVEWHATLVGFCQCNEGG